LGSRIITENDSIYQTISTIYEPNQPGLQCNFVLNSDTVKNIPNFISPSCFANFRLGPLKGSPCDTIVSGINEEKVGKLKVYPNPARDFLNVEFPSPYGKPYNIQIIDAMGQVVYASTLASEGANLSLSELKINTGLYLLQAQREGKLYYKRFLIEK
jgi:hypothetical protein